MKRAKNQPTRSQAKTEKHNASGPQKKPFIEHVYELRKRLFYVVLAIILGGSGAYFIQEKLLQFLLHPAGQQQFIYTAPGGGFSFLFNLCLYAGVVFAIPVLVWQLLRYLQPLMNHGAMRFIAWGSFASGVLAVIGILFGYLFALPAAMHFLLHQFAPTAQVEALIAIQSYLSFVMLYLVGSALLFQVPLIMILINRIKPLKPSKLMKFQRWFILIAFVTGAIISPSPNIQDQAMLSVPMILMYQLGIIIVWVINRKHRKAEKVRALREKDEAARLVRLQQFNQAQEVWIGSMQAATGTGPARTAPAARTWREEQTIPIKAVTVTAPAPRMQPIAPELTRRSYQSIPIRTD